MIRTWIAALMAGASLVCSDGAVDDGIGPGSGAGAIQEGIYYGVRTNLTTGHAIKVYMTFLADGRVFGGYPKEGLDVPVVWQRECKYAPCGTYTRRGSQVVMHWTGESARDETFRLDGEGVLHTTNAVETTYRRVQLMEGPMEGRYGIIGNDGTYTTTEITFSRDGRFSDDWVLKSTGWDAESSGTTVAGGTGTYTIRRGTLHLRYDDGTVAARLIMIPPAGDAQQRIQIGGSREYERIIE